MRVVQTFWTAGKSPLKESFGWLFPEYNLMSWALSCLSLRQQYDEVVLYTDSIGKQVLIDTLHLPYTDVKVVFDDFKCLPRHWALAKIMTYSLQEEPFIHVDGDVYLPNPIAEEVANSPLVAQNREIGTAYYKRMMDNIVSYPEIQLPPVAQKGLESDSLSSYNMGIFGGTDLDFIHRYCQTAIQFIESNGINDNTQRQSIVDCNVFFEQVLFAAMADNEGRDVASVIGRAVCDEGYTRREFCDMNHFGNQKLLHLLGGHKRNAKNIKSLEHLMLREYSCLYKNIVSLYPGRYKSDNDLCHVYSLLEAKQILPPEYVEYRKNLCTKWSDLQFDELFQLEQKIAQYNLFVSANQDDRQRITLTAYPHISKFSLPIECSNDSIQKIKSYIGCQEDYPLTMLVSRPTLKKYEFVEIPIQNLGLLIMDELSCNQVTLWDLQLKIASDIGFLDYKEEHLKVFIIQEVLELLQSGFIYII